PHPGYPKFMLQLVDPRARLRVDVFPGAADSIRRARSYDTLGVAVRVLGIDEILDHKLAILSGATEQRPVDGKHYEDALMIGRLVGRDIGVIPAKALCDDEYSRDALAKCPRCERSLDPRWPLAPKERILDLLGYV